MSAYTDLIETAVYQPYMALVAGPNAANPGDAFLAADDMYMFGSAQTLALGADHTFEFWGRPNAIDAGVHGAIETGGVTHGSAAGRAGDRWVATSSRNSTAETVTTPAGTAVAGQWTHVVVVFEQATIRVYLDGVLRATHTNTTAWTTDGNNNGAVGGLDNVQLGGVTSNNNDYWFDGDLAGVRVYATALDATQVDALYAAEVGAFTTVSGTTSAELRLAGSGDVVVSWGDGVYDVLGLLSAATSYSHTYAAPGEYEIRLLAGVSGVTQWLRGSSNWRGQAADLPANLTDLDWRDTNELAGDIADLPAALQVLKVEGATTITGLTSALPATVTEVGVRGNNTITIDTIAEAVRDLRIDNLSRESIDNAIQSAWAHRNAGGSIDYTLQFGTAEAPTDTMAALADALNAGTLGTTAFDITFDTPAAETNEALTYEEMIALEPLVGFYPTGDAASDAAVETASATLSAGPPSAGSPLLRRRRAAA